MENNNDQGINTLLDQLAIDRKQDEADDLAYSEYSIALNIISKVMLNGLSKTDMRILHGIIANINFKNQDKFAINQTELAESLFMKQPNIARSMKKLIAAQMLEKLDDDNYQLLITKPYSHGKNGITEKKLMGRHKKTTRRWL